MFRGVQDADLVQPHDSSGMAGMRDPKEVAWASLREEDRNLARQVRLERVSRSWLLRCEPKERTRAGSKAASKSRYAA